MQPLSVSFKVSMDVYREAVSLQSNMAPMQFSQMINPVTWQSFTSQLTIGPIEPSDCCCSGCQTCGTNQCCAVTGRVLTILFGCIASLIFLIMIIIIASDGEFTPALINFIMYFVYTALFLLCWQSCKCCRNSGDRKWFLSQHNRIRNLTQTCFGTYMGMKVSVTLPEIITSQRKAESIITFEISQATMQQPMPQTMPQQPMAQPMAQPMSQQPMAQPQPQYGMNYAPQSPQNAQMQYNVQTSVALTVRPTPAGIVQTQAARSGVPPASDGDSGTVPLETTVVAPGAAVNANVINQMSSMGSQRGGMVNPTPGYNPAMMGSAAPNNSIPPMAMPPIGGQMGAPPLYPELDAAPPAYGGMGLEMAEGGEGKVTSEDGKVTSEDDGGYARKATNEYN